MKVCKKCGTLKELSFFPKRVKNKDGLLGYCKECYKKQKLQTKLSNISEYKKKELSYSNSYKKKYPDKAKLYARSGMLRRNYNMTLDEYNIMLLSQNNSCAICGRDQSEFSESLVVDHNHSTGEIRGLLCSSCNRGIGYLKDSTDILTKAIDYLTSKLKV